jgi:hypothetical protein
MLIVLGTILLSGCETATISQKTMPEAPKPSMKMKPAMAKPVLDLEEGPRGVVSIIGKSEKFPWNENGFGLILFKSPKKEDFDDPLFKLNAEVCKVVLDRLPYKKHGTIGDTQRAAYFPTCMNPGHRMVSVIRQYEQTGLRGNSSCAVLLHYYDYDRAAALLDQFRRAIPKIQNEVPNASEGPFLIAVSVKSATLTNADALVLDLSRLKAGMADDVVKRWLARFVTNPSQWDKGWIVEKVFAEYAAILPFALETIADWAQLGTDAAQAAVSAREHARTRRQFDDLCRQG